jgi:hypothetical protein
LFFQIAKNGSISVAKYLALLEETTNLNQSLAKAVNEQSVFQAKFAANQAEISKLHVEINQFREYDNQGFLNGQWEILYRDETATKSKLQVNGHLVQLREQDGASIKDYSSCSISFFKHEMRDPEKLTFQLQINDGGNSFLRTFILHKSGSNEFSGSEDIRNQVFMSRIS